MQPEKVAYDYRLTLYISSAYNAVLIILFRLGRLFQLYSANVYLNESKTAVATRQRHAARHPSRSAD